MVNETINSLKCYNNEYKIRKIYINFSITLVEIGIIRLISLIKC